MKKLKTYSLILIIFLVGTIFSSGYITAQSQSFSGKSSTAGFVNYQARASYTGGISQSTYWPTLSPDVCKARQDILLNVRAFGCKPAVVRSDLLAEQDVPVFCQIDAFNINPLIDIGQIRNVRFIGDYPPEVAGFGFYPAKAALRKNDMFLDAPLLNNIGYLVVILKRQPDESKLPDSVSVSLIAELDYVAANVLGVGKNEFLLEQTVNENGWNVQKLKQSFWKGRYSARLEEVNKDFAVLSIYEGNRKLTTNRVERGKLSNEIYVPGSYCQAGLQLAYDGLVAAKNKARIALTSDSGTEVFEVHEGEKFFDERCIVKSITPDKNSATGRVTGNCKGKNFILELKPSAAELLKEFNAEELPKLIDGSYQISVKGKGKFRLDANEKLFNIPEKGGEEKQWTNSDGTFTNNLPEGERDFAARLWNALKAYKKGNSLADREIKGQARDYFKEAILNYERIVDEYPSEKEGRANGSRKYGEIAMEEAVRLADDFGAQATAARLLGKQIETYPDSGEILNSRLEEALGIDSSYAGEPIEFDNSIKTLKLISLSEPKTKSSAELGIDGKRVTLNGGESYIIKSGSVTLGEIVLDDIEKNSITLSAFCIKDEKRSERKKFGLNLDGDAKPICEASVKLLNTNLEENAKIRIIPLARGLETRTNLSLEIGIEKRAIKLNPDKTEERIEELNKTIQKWEKISKTLGNVVTGLKTACFATAALLTFKNFLTGLSGEALARQEVMNGPGGWKSICGDDDACYLQHTSEIERDVAAYTRGINNLNSKIQEIQNRHTTNVDIFGQSVNEDALRADLAKEARARYGTVQIDTAGFEGPWGEKGQIYVNEILSDENIKNRVVSVNEIRSIMLYSELKNQRLSPAQSGNVQSKLKEITEKINENRLIQDAISREDELTRKGLAPPVYEVGEGLIKPAHIVRAGTSLKTKYQGFDEKITHSATFVDRGGKVYILGLKESDSRKRIYTTEKIWSEDGALLTDSAQFAKNHSIGNLKAADSFSYANEIALSDRKVRYYETEPYKGMPAIVPFDVRKGWYAATRQTLPVFGGIGAFDASGRVTSFWLCNVGDNKRIEFESGFGDDLCQQINLNTGQPLGKFPGLQDDEARALVTRATRAIEDAARGYGNKQVRILGEPFEVGAPSTGQPGTRCQDFMSPTDCHLMFNVCDPVICPSSRCDFGGTYPVANVAQTGIIGSALLCLPNIREGIAIPVCLTGIHAGIDAFVSIMRNHRDCLQENLKTGQFVGICDEIYSIYLCEFFWGQMAPLIDILIPKIIEIAYGQGVRGGGEYLTVMSAWQNMQSSINYFTQSYAVNSLTAFQARSGLPSERVYGSGAIAEIGTQFCKSFVGVKAPKAFQTLVEPDSPPQFHAWFDSRRFSDATVPATAQYKVFYHIFAGKDQGVDFQVYLKNPPESSYYSIPRTILVASSFIPRGEYASETKDFTAPEGYKELCVRINGNEECGFKQVSTNFAINYLRDIYVNSELEKTQIRTERECVSGGANPGALLNPNIQSGAEETISPEIYNRGVVRICSTQNPGLGTEPERFLNVGYCNDPKVGCWLDARSIENAITASNIGLKNETLNELRNSAQSFEDTSVLGSDEIIAEIFSLEEDLNKLDKSRNIIDDAQDILNRIDVVYKKTVFNNHKARLLLIKARTNAKVALNLYEKERALERPKVLPEEQVPVTETPETETETREEWFSIAGEDELDKAVIIIVSSDNQAREFEASGFLVPLRNKKIGVITNEHAIEINNIILDYVEGREFVGRILETDSKNDIAILETEMPIERKVLEFDSEELEQGDSAFLLTRNRANFSEVNLKLLRVVSQGPDVCEEDYGVKDDGTPVLCKGQSIYVVEPVNEKDKVFQGDSGSPVFDLNRKKVIGVIDAATFKTDSEGKPVRDSEERLIPDDEQQAYVIPINLARESFSEHLVSSYSLSLGKEEREEREKQECEISNAQWLNSDDEKISSASEGDDVKLNVKSENCEGKSIEFDIYERDFYLFDKKQLTLTEEISSETVSVDWNAVWIEDFGFFDKDPEFYFVARVKDSNVKISSEELKVSKKAEESAGKEKEEVPEREIRTFTLKKTEGSLKEEVWLGNVYTGIYIRNGVVYKEASPRGEPVGSLIGGLGENSRIDISDNKINEAGEQQRCYLIALKDKLYGELQRGEIKELEDCPSGEAADIR